MGLFLNGTKPYELYKSEVAGNFFVDKTMILKELIPLAHQGKQCICITRPRRFGKTVMANMIGAFFNKGADSSDIFDKLEISEEEGYEENQNRHNVIYISFNEMPEECGSYKQYIGRISGRLKRDLKKAYPDFEIDTSEAVWDILSEILEETKTEKFIFVLDEWDFIFHQNFITKADREHYVKFLSNLLKDKEYVSLAYMTGILPISKYSSGSDLNMFDEYSMATKIRFSEWFGFTEPEVDMLYQRYLNNVETCGVSREELRLWYDGYQTPSGERMYNPRSVVSALKNNQIANYWTSSGLTGY